MGLCRLCPVRFAFGLHLSLILKMILVAFTRSNTPALGWNSWCSLTQAQLALLCLLGGSGLSGVSTTSAGATHRSPHLQFGLVLSSLSYDNFERTILWTTPLIPYYSLTLHSFKAWEMLQILRGREPFCSYSAHILLNLLDFPSK